MESLSLFLLGLLIFLSLIGGIVSFFGMFGRGEEKRRLHRRLEDIETQLKTLQNSAYSTDLNTPVTTKAQEIQPPVEAPTPVEISREPIASAGLDSPENAQSLPLNERNETETPKPAVPVITPPIVPPNALEKALLAAKDWLLGGNTLVRSGIVILFIGISFLLKYAAEHTHVPISVRLAGIALSGVALLAIGWRLRTRRSEYAWAMQGGGIGILYLTLFAAFKLYQLVPPNLVFLLLVVIAALSALLAVLQSALPLAVLGFAGGFLAPVLTSTGEGSHVALFSYYLVLNIAITGIAFYRSWRPLNLLGFAFTFVIGTLWGAKSYQPELFATTEPFLLLHFLLYTAIAIIYAHQQSVRLGNFVDSTLVFGTPIIGFSLQYALLQDSPFGLAYSALALGIFYLGLTWWILTRKRESLRFLGECFLALGIGFATLTLPLALDGRWTSAAWAVEGVALLWAGLKQQRRFPMVAGLSLQVLGAMAFAYGWGLTGHSDPGHQNMFLGVAFIALSGWACGALLERFRPGKYAPLGMILAIWGWLWWVNAGFAAIGEFLEARLFDHIGLLFVALSSLALIRLAQWLRWPTLASMSGLLLPVMGFFMLIELWEAHPFQNMGWLAWPVAFAIYGWLILHQPYRFGSVMRAPFVWLIAIIGAMEWQYQLQYWVPEAIVWGEIGQAIVPMLLIAAVLYWQPRLRLQSADGKDHSHAWLWYGSGPLMGFLLLWFFDMSLHANGQAKPLPYLPLLNPLDLTLAAVLLLLLLWYRQSRALGTNTRLPELVRNIILPLTGMMAFTLINGVLLRTLHHWAGTPLQWTAIFSNTLVQVSFTFLWGVTALLLMLLGHRQGRRLLWLIGAALIGLVVLKLFLLDLAGHGSVERILSFIGAGILLLIMGYFAPLPPAKSNRDTTQEIAA